ncbi:MAG TPA: zinc ribbon domain-containing protein [Burkholderiales bacterium]|nr:zinc ribbon domain-containing protein [Burkholderiales bacterium]
MPIYEYRCSSCGFQKEYLRKVSDPTLSVCPECGKNTFSKMLSAAGFQLKGSGWYATDFKNSGSKPAVKSSVETGDKGAAKPEGKDSGSGKADKTESSPAKSAGNTESKPTAAA